MSNISEFELDEIVLKISECFQAPMADDGISAVEGDGNKIKDILRSLLQSRQLEWPSVTERDIDRLLGDLGYERFMEEDEFQTAKKFFESIGVKVNK